MKGRIYDCFTFSDEVELLTIRLNELNDVVDHFVLVESTLTFSGREKDLVYQVNRDRFREFHPKIIHVVVDDMPSTDSRWEREFFQRNAILRGLSDCRDDDLVLISDVDEIPQRDKIEAGALNGPVVFSQRCFYYYLNCLSNEQWNGTIMVRFGDITTPQDLRDRRNDIPRIGGGGWHFSFLGGVERIKKKIESFAHDEFDSPFFKDEGRIIRHLAEGTDLFDRRGLTYRFVPIDETFPEFLRNNREKYRHLIRDQNTPTKGDRQMISIPGNPVLNGNLALLDRTQPGLSAVIRSAAGGDAKVLQSRTGHPSMRAGSVTLHSLYDPEREAQEWVRHHRDLINEASALVVLGFGLGYHVRALCAEIDREIIVFEPRADILRQAFELSDFSSVIPRIRIVVNGEIPVIRGDVAVLDHKPSLSLSPNFFARVRWRLDALEDLRDGLRIIVVGPFYGGSLSVARHCASALRNIGHDVTFVDNSVYGEAFRGIEKITENGDSRGQLRLMLSEFASEAVIARCVDSRPDLVIALAQAPLQPGSLMKLRQNNIPTAFWFVEDYRLRGYWREIAPLYDCFFTIQQGRFMDELRAMGVQAGYLPLAASPEVHRPLELTPEEADLYGSDLSFVGAGYRNRRHFLAGLLDYGLKVWGSEWDMTSPLAPFVQRSGGWVETDEIVRIFNATKVNINLHSSAHHDGIDPAGDFVNPRTFEIAACGGFQVVDHRNELAGLFDIGREIVCFTDLADLREKAGYYLERPDERMAVAELSRQRVLRDHTYELRMDEMLRFVVNHGRLSQGDRPRRAGRDTLVREAGPETVLGRYLSTAPKKGAMDLDDVIDGIAQGRSDLSETERIFMLMNEMKKVYTKK